MSSSVLEWQKILDDLYLYHGDLDGDFGPMTLAASMELLDAEDLGGTQMTGKPIETIRPQFAYRAPRRSVNELIWHCAATPEGRHFDVADINRWHKARGWSGIGYHFVVELDGTITAGRSNEKRGAHVGGRNTNTIGACYIGGVTADGKKAKDTRTAAQRASMLWLTREIAKDPRIKRISGHNQYAAKACPSFDVRSDELGNIAGFKRGIRT